MRHKILTGVFALVLVIIIASVASGGGGSDDDSNTATDETSTSSQPSQDDANGGADVTEDAEADAPAPEPSEEAEPEKAEGSLPQEDGDWRLDSVQLKDDGLGDFGGIARITYIGEDTNATNIFTVTVLGKSGNVIATLNGSAEGMNPDGTETVQLISSDTWKPGNYKSFDFQKGF